jgi:hypothetical protein
MRTIKTYRKVGAFYIAWEEDFSTVKAIATVPTWRLSDDQLAMLIYAHEKLLDVMRAPDLKKDKNGSQ